MPAPALIAPLVPLAGKAATWFGGTKLASLLGLGGKLAGKAAATAVANPYSASGALKAAATVGKSRMATQALETAAKKGLFGKIGASTFGQNFGAMMPKSAAEWGMRIAPDAIFGGMAALNTPGDIGDKLIAGTAATAGGALGGLGMRGVIGGVSPRIMNNTIADISTEMIGGVGGDMMAQGVADGVMRVKGGGTTPYEKMAAEQQRELEQQILQRYLSGKGGYPMDNGVA